MSLSYTVFLVDDHALTRTGIKMLLNNTGGIEVIGEASSGEAAIPLVQQLKPQIILMDIDMPGIGGLTAAQKLLKRDSGLKILGLSVYKTGLLLTRFLQSGAAGYIHKGASTEDLTQAIRLVCAGKRYISPCITQQLAIKYIDAAAETSPFFALSERELQVTLLIIQGMKIKTLAETLCLERKTINMHRYQIFKKLSIKNDVELTHLAIRFGLTRNSGAIKMQDLEEI